MVYVTLDSTPAGVSQADSFVASTAPAVCQGETSKIATVHYMLSAAAVGSVVLCTTWYVAYVYEDFP